MVDFQKILDRAMGKLSDLKDGNSVGAIIKGDPMVSGTQIFATREDAISAAENANMSDNERQIVAEAETVIDEMTRDIFEEIDRRFLS